MKSRDVVCRVSEKIKKMKKYLLVVVFLVFASVLSIRAQDTKVAVWGPSVKNGSDKMETIEMDIIHSRFRDAVSDMDGIELVSRSDVDNILEELKFQQNGMVSENDKKLLGQMKGVDIIVSLTVSKGLGRINISASFIDVEKANVVGRTQSVLANANDADDLEYKCVELAGKLTGVTGSASPPRTTFPGGGSAGTDLTFIIPNSNVSFKMVFVKGGTFQMGSYSGDENEKPVHSVTVSDFYMGEFEVTQALWREVMGTSISQQRDKANTSWSLFGDGDGYPMYYVSHSEAEEFCRRLNQRLRGQLPAGYSFALPTEAEWEYAAQGGSKTNAYTYSGSNYLSDVGWYNGNSPGGTQAVGTLRPNELGLYDMSGNVMEWCADCYDKSYYSTSPSQDPRGPSCGQGSDRVLRGGCWDFGESYCRVVDRFSISPGCHSYDSGFRLSLVRR